MKEDDVHQNRDSREALKELSNSPNGKKKIKERTLRFFNRASLSKRAIKLNYVRAEIDKDGVVVAPLLAILAWDGTGSGILSVISSSGILFFLLSRTCSYRYRYLNLAVNFKHTAVIASLAAAVGLVFGSAWDFVGELASDFHAKQH